MSDETDWPSNYFNYFTEIEDHFQRARGTGLFLLSPLDWALIENWKTGGIPLDAVLKGIDDAFEKWHARKSKRRLINSVAYCAQAVSEAAKRAPQSQTAAAKSQPAFAPEDIRRYLVSLSERIPFAEIAAALEGLAADAEKHADHLEELEQRLTAMEEKLVASARLMQSEEDLFAIRQSLDKELKPYRGKMTADQISMLERRYMDSALLERAKLPRLSLFYLTDPRA